MCQGSERDRQLLFEELLLEQVCIVPIPGE
jgi:hypothetical protein